MDNIRFAKLPKGAYLIVTDGSERGDFETVIKNLARQMASGSSELLSDASLLDWIGRTKPRAVATPADSHRAISIHLLKHAFKVMAMGNFRRPYRWDAFSGWVDVRMTHLAELQTDETAARWGGKVTSRVLQRELLNLGLLDALSSGKAKEVERTIDGHRVGHMVSIHIGTATELVLAHPEE